MPRKTKTEQELGYIRSFWDEIRTLSADYSAVVSMFVEATGRPGVLKFRLIFTPLVEREENHLGSAAVQFEYPNGSVQTLAGALWTQAIKLQQVVADAREGHATRQINGG